MQNLPQILAAIRREFNRTLGDKLETIYLYGSQARGDALADSDIDILAVIRGDFDYADLLELTSPAVSSLSLENDTVISRAFISKEQFDHENSPFLINVRREGIAI